MDHLSFNDIDNWLQVRGITKLVWSSSLISQTLDFGYIHNVYVAGPFGYAQVMDISFAQAFLMALDFYCENTSAKIFWRH